MLITFSDPREEYASNKESYTYQRDNPPLAWGQPKRASSWELLWPDNGCRRWRGDCWCKWLFCERWRKRRDGRVAWQGAWYFGGRCCRLALIIVIIVI